MPTTIVRKSMVPIALLSAVAAGMHIVPASAAEHRTADFGPDGFTRGSGLPTSKPHFLPAPASYIVGTSDSLEVIATRFGLDAGTVAALNGLAADSSVHEGQSLTLTDPAASTSATTASATTASATTTYVVKSGDTVSRIASKHGVSTQSVLTANKLSWSSVIYPGDRLTVPGASTGSTESKKTSTDAGSSTSGTYTVVSGDTVSSIAGKHGVSTASVLAANDLSWSSVIYPGQKLTIPGSSTGSTESKKSSSTKESSKDTGSSTSGTYTVVSGDTVSSIAGKHGVSTASVLAVNDLSWSSVIYPGQKLTIPGSSTGGSDSGTDDSKESSKDSGSSTSGSYTVVSGDTVSRIAAKHDVSIQAVLDANDLTWSSIIYVGQKLTIPGTASSESGSSKKSESSENDEVTPLTSAMKANAQTIIRVGRSLGVSDYGLVIALAAAMQESGLRNVDYGDRDSLGLFQQRTSQGWGTKEQIMNPEYAATAFFVGVSGKTRGLLDISGWTDMSVTEAAQAVQVSGYPNAYAKWETSARSWLKKLG